MARRKTPEEKKAEKERIDRWYQDKYNRSIKKKADQLNKIMNGKDVKDVQHSDNWWTVYFKNGQVFNFTFLPDCIYSDRKIIPIFD
jgi:predicted NAD/FAD-dependent oxidoreductase